MPPLNSARRRALRAMLSAVAGGGLTAASLGGPLASGAFGAATTTSTPVSTDGSSAPAAADSGAAAQEAAGAQEAAAGQPSTSTSTAPAASAAPTETSTAPSTTAPSTTAPQPSAPATGGSEAPTVVLQRKQETSPGTTSSPVQTTIKAKTKTRKSTKPTNKTSGPNNVAPSPQSVAVQAGALAAVLASSEASAAALDFYRIPLFLLPIYKAAAVQYGVPWQILAAINEIETDYGTDQSVSSAGAVGWMQFMPSTWLQYGVDALNAGYADPYNPVDAIFAAARYLRAAGAATDLHAAILAYNHSEEYVDSVLLRAKLISTYPKAVIATLTGLIDGRLPVSGKHVAWSSLLVPPPSASSATAQATAVPSKPASGSAGASGRASGSSPSPASSTPGSSPPLSPAAAAAAARSGAGAPAVQPLQLVELLSAPNASVVAVQDGRIVHIGHSRSLGKYVVLRDVYGDVFTYVGLGSIAPTYALPKAPSAPARSPVVEAASTRDPAPSQPASAGTQSPVTLHVTTPRPRASAHGQASLEVGSQEAAPAGMGKVRLFAHPGNVDALAAAAASAARNARQSSAGQRLPLRSGSVVASGTVLGRVRVPPGARDGHLRFAISPAGDADTVNPGPILDNWSQLQTALHPRGAKATDALLGATASDVLLLSKAQLERTVLSDPGITLDRCTRHEVVSGMVDRRVLAVLAFLSRSGLKPTVSALECAQRQDAAAAALSSRPARDDVEISAINGVPIAGHQGPGTITDLTIRTLLTLPGDFVPHAIVSLMRYPGSSNTHAATAYWNRIRLQFRPARVTAALNPAAAATAAHSARSGRTAPAPLVSTSALSATQWSQLMERVAALPAPTVATKRSPAAVPDPKRP